ncbi:MAG TPA: type I-C CRISPR-associated protein Cas7/Csd2 [Bryobacteraceae bacterium]|nr:type I-C CRISPR-associated protein Cas7/Csd2 [Bryobacteraceae bacterium]
MSVPLTNRYDFVYLFDVVDGNPNGDPDAGNLPRVDAETSQGLVTDVCLKRKIRNYVTEAKGGQPPHEIYVKEKAVLNSNNERAYTALGLKPEPKKLPKEEAKAREVTRWMCKNFFDIRAFGAVMTTEINSGQVRGPIQFTIARSIDPVVSAEFSITRCAVTNEKDLEKERTMGRKFTVPYGLYRCYGYINATLAEQTGFTEDDLGLVKDALNNMFELDRSAARGLMAPVRCVAFRHENRLGNARADQLFSRVKVQLRPELKTESRPARTREDYLIEVDRTSLPAGVTVEEWVK